MSGQERAMRRVALTGFVLLAVALGAVAALPRTPAVPAAVLAIAALVCASVAVAGWLITRQEG